MSTNQIVSKVWSFCNTLRDDGVRMSELGFVGFQDDRMLLSCLHLSNPSNPLIKTILIQTNEIRRDNT